MNACDTNTRYHVNPLPNIHMGCSEHMVLPGIQAEKAASKCPYLKGPEELLNGFQVTQTLHRMPHMQILFNHSMLHTQLIFNQAGLMDKRIHVWLASLCAQQHRAGSAGVQCCIERKSHGLDMVSWPSDLVQTLHSPCCYPSASGILAFPQASMYTECWRAFAMST